MPLLLPFLPYMIIMSLLRLLFVIFITILNLRGVTESASILAYPVYLFVLALFILIGVGIYNIVTGEISPTFMHQLEHLLQESLYFFC